MVMEIPPQFLLLLPLSIAAGVDLYLTLLAVGVVSGLGIEGWAEPVISPWAGGSVLISLAVLVLAETVMESRSFLALVWHNLQLLLRPLGAALLGLFLFQGETLGFLALAVGMASVVAAFSHALVWGQSLILRIAPDQPLPPMGFKAVGGLTSLVLISLTLFNPDFGALLGTLLLLLGLIFGRSLHGAVRFGWTLLVDRVWGIVSPTEWQPRDELPDWIRDMASFGPMDGVRWARAATWCVVGPRRFKDGWILQKNLELFFVFRLGRSPQVIQLGGANGKVELGPVSRTILYPSSEGVSSALFLQLGLNDPESHK